MGVCAAFLRARLIPWCASSSSALLLQVSMAKDGAVKVFVPGRVCLLGEHTDWSSTYGPQNKQLTGNGHCLVYGTDLGLYADVCPTPPEGPNAGKMVFSSTVDDGSHKELVVDFEENALESHAKNGDDFFSYMCGTVAVMLRDDKVKTKLQPLRIHNYETTLPIQKGLSSSAAVCVLVVESFNKVFDLNLTVDEIMDFAYRGEIDTPSQCGRMDQCVAFGRVCTSMRFKDGQLTCSRVHIPKDCTFYFVVADLRRHKDTPLILKSLNGAFPLAKNEIEQNVQLYLDRLSLEFSNAAERALELGDAKSLGEICVAAQASFKTHLTPICPQELSAPKLYSVLENEKILQHVYGGKGVGSQGDGSVQFVCKDENSQREVVRILNEELECHAFAMKLSGEV